MFTLPPNPPRRYNVPSFGPTTTADATATARPAIPTQFLIPPPSAPVPFLPIPQPAPRPQPVAKPQRFNQVPEAPATTAAESTRYNRPVPVADQFLSEQEFYQKHGQTRRQLGGYQPLVSELIYNTVYPFGYGLSPGEKLRNPELEKLPEMTRRYSAFAAYLGLPTNPADLPLSTYAPTHRNSKTNTETGSGGNQEYFAFSPAHESWLFDKVKNLPDSDWKRLPNGTQYRQEVDRGGIAGNFTVYKGQDKQGPYYSYHDNWDLEPSGVSVENLVGKPYEIYNRIYYDAQTRQPISEAIRKAQGTGITPDAVFQGISNKPNDQTRTPSR